MALQDQIKLYSVDTSNFYNDDELEIHKELSKLFFEINQLKNKINIIEKNKKSKTKTKDLQLELIIQDVEQEDAFHLLRCYDYALVNEMARIKSRIKFLRKEIEYRKWTLRKKLVFNSEIKQSIRELNAEALNEKNVVAMFKSALTRTIGLKTEETTDELIIVQTYYFEVLKDLIKNGFTYNGEKYRMFTASAGQIRQKKTVFIKENTWEEHKNSLMCGLTEEGINKTEFTINDEKVYGVNINKFLAYLALTNSATDEWKDFDIDRCIVVDDLETVVNCEVDYIDETSYDIDKKVMDISIESTDGCGIMCWRKYKKPHMFRANWIKGLLVPFPFRTYIDKSKRKERDKQKKKQISKVIDIYGKEWDIEKDEIDIIFTKSQFKMAKYYTNEYDEDGNIIKYGWDKYKEAFKKYGCEAGICNIEPDRDEFGEVKINYQMLQTLTDISNKEIKELCSKTNETISKVGKDRETMLKLLGATEENDKKNGFQKAILLYPELLRDESSKRTLSEVKKSYVKAAKGGRLEIEGRYTFIIPDLYAFCEKIFSKIEKPEGLLKRGEVFCKLYEDEKELDCLRSPHLYREHVVRNNKAKDKELRKWFKTYGLYISNDDPISKIIMCDWDGDTSLVTPSKTLIEIAKRNMKDIRPLYYDMKTATVEKLSEDSKYNGMINAYSGGNIGMISNEITKVWNSENVDSEAIDVVKILCKVNNEVIDFAKTLHKNEIPKGKNKMIKKYTKSKVPYFFKYAKDKLDKNVEKINNSTMNKICKAVVNSRIDYDLTKIGNIDYKMLMKFSKRCINDDARNKIIETYERCNKDKRFRFNQVTNEDSNIKHITSEIRKEIIGEKDKDFVIDVLVEHLYKKENTNMKTLLWDCFGHDIARNIEKNLEKKCGMLDLIFCEECGKRIVKESNRSKYCDECWQEIEKKNNRKYARESMRRKRNKEKC